MLCASALAWSADMSHWQASIDTARKERFIPVELWNGGQWDGKRDLAMNSIDGSYSHRRTVFHIKGPMDWKHPETGETYRVYERLNPGAGLKKQLFAINPEKSGLGRVYDARPGLGLRTLTGGLKFPLGLWKEGETRKFVYRHFADSGVSMRMETLTLRRIDFVYQGTPHCIDFDWTMTDADGPNTYDRDNYIYCPGKSMVGEGWQYRSPD